MEIILIYVYFLPMLSRYPQLLRFVYNSVLTVFVIGMHSFYMKTNMHLTHLA